LPPHTSGLRWDGHMRRRIRRWAGWTLVTAAILAVFGVLFFQGPWWADGDRLRTLAGKEQHEALSKDRDAVLKIVAGAGAVVVLVFTGRSYLLAREGHVTDRYSKAVEQLGSTNLDVRLGGIYALERIMRDSPKDHPTIVAVLAAFIREHATAGAPPRPDTTTGHPASRRIERMRARLPQPTPEPDPKLAADIQAALTVLARRHRTNDRGLLDLSWTDLRRASLSGAQLQRAYLFGARLESAYLFRAQLQGAILTGAALRDANLERAQLRGANLHEAQLQGASLIWAQLQAANLERAQLHGADLRLAQLQDANLERAQLQDAKLHEAQLQRVNLRLAQLQGADLFGAALRDANLVQARLQGAQLQSAQLQGAELQGAELQGANLRDTKGLTNGQLAEAATDEHTQLPEHLQTRQGDKPTPP